MDNALGGLLDDSGDWPMSVSGLRMDMRSRRKCIKYLMLIQFYPTLGSTVSERQNRKDSETDQTRRHVIQACDATFQTVLPSLNLNTKILRVADPESLRFCAIVLMLYRCPQSVDRSQF